MFTGAISFFGTLSRKGFIVTLLVCVIGTALSVIIADRAVTGPPRMTVGQRDIVFFVLIGVIALFTLSLLGAMVRRLRDAGSPLPFLELLIAAAIPGFGWLWLLVRLLIFGTKDPTEHAEQVPEQTDRVWPQNARAARSGAATMPPAWARAIKTVLERRMTQPPSDPQTPTRIVHDEHVHDRVETHTVRRAKRVFGPKARRQVGF